MENFKKEIHGFCKKECKQVENDLEIADFCLLNDIEV
jgi:hypothetical protein